MTIVGKHQLRAQLLENGAVASLTADNIMINQVEGNILDGALSNIYLRIQKDNKTVFAPLINSAYTSRVDYNQTTIIWHGQVDSAVYRLVLSLADTSWFWTLSLKAAQTTTADIFYTQDLGLGTQNFLESNEAYASQYLDHQVKKQGNKIVVTSRQNMNQDGRNPFVQQGSFNPLRSFTTDGFQFFGTQYKGDGVPKAAEQDQLEGKIQQYEFAFTALQSETLTLTNKPQNIVFYGTFLPDSSEGNLGPRIDESELKTAYKTAIQTAAEDLQALPLARLQKQISLRPVSGADFTDSEIDTLFKQRSQNEIRNQQLLSFFLPDNTHVVLKAKELQSERATGNIVLAGHTIEPTHRVLASTQYMTGIFASQTVYGNTSMNRLSANVRNPLNIMKLFGQRIYLKQNGTYQPLGVPSAFAMQYNSADWYYKLPDDLIKISVDGLFNEQALSLHFESNLKRRYDLFVTDYLVMSETDHGLEPAESIQNNIMMLYPADGSAMKQKNPQLSFLLDFSKHNAKQFTVADSTSLFNQNITLPKLKIWQYTAVSQFDFTVRPQFDYETSQQIECSGETGTDRKSHHEYMENFVRHFELTGNNTIFADLDKMNRIVRWFAHDALVHLLSPHGLEQYQGAAFGTRDVAQGPTELFLAFQHYPEVKKIIWALFSHQFIENGNWAQWFMFDEYQESFANESHGDVIIWPLKVVTDYIRATGDHDILDEVYPYMSLEKKQPTEIKESLRQHLLRELNYISTHFLYDTHVSQYGDGDWDDTLQPANADKKAEMASTWTEELTLQVLKSASQVFSFDQILGSKTKQLLKDMMPDFEHYFLSDNSDIPGFIQMTPDHTIKKIIHQGDQVAKIQYRLLPLTRGIIGGIFSQETADKALETIKQHLMFSDGVRLMNRPAQYQGGVSHIFKRAELSANFGREIGLMYTHAHIRFLEALAALNQTECAFQESLKVNPIQIHDILPQSELRQANVYFSSSDAAFSSRYEAQEQFDKLKKGQVKIKGGWRLYSSGPGIFIHEFLTNIIGISVQLGEAVFAPVLPNKLLNNDLQITYDFGHGPVIIKYVHDIQAINKQGIQISKYGRRGTKVALDQLTAKKIKINYK